jgi:hypothetical protein
MEILRATDDDTLSIQSIVTTAKGAPNTFVVEIEPGGKTTTTIQLHHHLTGRSLPAGASPARAASPC